MTLKEALKRIEALERRVRELEAHPVQQHWHFHQPTYPAPIPAPINPLPAPWDPTTPIWGGGDGVIWAGGERT